MFANSQLPSAQVAIRPKPLQAGSAELSSGQLYRPSASACQISITASSTGIPSPSSTRQVSDTRSPFAAGPAICLTERSSVVRQKLKNGPTVCDGVGISSISCLEGGRLRSPEHDVEPVSRRPLRLGRLQIEP